MNDDRTAELCRWLLRSTPDDVYDYGFAGCERCLVCGRAIAAEDCEPELDLPVQQRMCRADTDGSDPTCTLGVRSAPPALVGPWHEDPAIL